jgi:hypothetical protein
VITIYKTANTKIPKLLIDGQVTQRSAEQISPSPSERQPSDSTTAPSASNPGLSVDSGKKVLVMKRRTPASNQTNKNNDGAKPQLSTEEREKAYQEARARIFGNESSTTEESPITASSAAPQQPEDSNKANVAQYLVNRNERNVSSSRPLSKNPSGASLNEQDEPEEQNPSSSSNFVRSANSSGKEEGRNPKKGGQTGNRPGGKGRLVDVGSWKENKSQVRDKDAERSDPDFVRRGSPSVSTTTSTAATAGGGGGNYSSSSSSNAMNEGMMYGNPAGGGYDGRYPLYTTNYSGYDQRYGMSHHQQQQHQPQYPIPPAPTLNAYYPPNSSSNSSYDQSWSNGGPAYPPPRGGQYSQNEWPSLSSSNQGYTNYGQPQQQQPHQFSDYRSSNRNPNPKHDFPPLS